MSGNETSETSTFGSITCQPSDGLHKSGHPECEECDPQVKAVCRVFATELGAQDVVDIVRQAKEE
jgi:hypothetical protein